MARKPRPWFRKDRNSWFVYLNGKQHNLGQDPKLAQVRFRQLLEGESQPNKSETTPDDHPTINELAAEYLFWYSETRKRNSYNVTRNRLKPFLEDFGNCQPKDLTPGLIEQWTKGFEWSPSSVNGTIAAIEAMLSWSVRERCIPENPIKGIKKPPIGQRSVLLSDDDVKRLLKAAPPDLKPMIEMLEATGARPDVICKLDASSIDWEKGTAKGFSKKRPYILYIPSKQLDLLRRLAKLYPDGALLRTERGRPWKPKHLYWKLDRLGQELGIRVFPYAFRHRFATRKLKEGYPPAVVAQLLNHRDLTMISRHYNQLIQMHNILRDAVEGKPHKPK